MDLIAIALIISVMMALIETSASEQIWKQNQETTNEDFEDVILETLAQQSRDLKRLLRLSQMNADHMEEMAKTYKQLVDRPKGVDRADLFLPFRRSDINDDALDSFSVTPSENNSDGKNNIPVKINSNTPFTKHFNPSGNYNNALDGRKGILDENDNALDRNNDNPDGKTNALDTNNKATLVSMVKFGLNIPQYSRLIGHHISNEINTEIDPIRELLQRPTAAAIYV